jgi:uncharacterized membrane protein
MVARLGSNPYRGLFTLVIVASLVLMVFGWRQIIPETLYSPPAWGRLAAAPLMLIAFVLFVASNMAGNLKRWLRHPQLTGVATWAVAHLLANGEDRSVLLFGVMLVWALLAIVLINRRDGAWQKPAKADPVQCFADGLSFRTRIRESWGLRGPAHLPSSGFE